MLIYDCFYVEHFTQLCVSVWNIVGLHLCSPHCHWIKMVHHHRSPALACKAIKNIEIFSGVIVYKLRDLGDSLDGV